MPEGRRERERRSRFGSDEWFKLRAPPRERSSNPAGPERERACPVIVVTVRGGPTRLQLLTPLGTSVSLFQGAGLAPTPSGRSAILSSSPTLTAFCAPATLGGGRLRLRVHDSGKDGQLANLLDVAAPTPTSIFSTRPVGMEETVTTEATARSLQLQLQQEHFVLSGEIQKAMPVWTILRRGLQLTRPGVRPSPNCAMLSGSSRSISTQKMPFVPGVRKVYAVIPFTATVPD